MTELMAERSVIVTQRTAFQAIQPWVVVFIAATFFFFEFMQVNMFNALDPDLFKAYRLHDSTQLGNLAANYMYANVIFLFPAGIILDRFSTKRVIIAAMLCCVVFTLLFSMTTELWQGELCRFMTGIAGAFCLLSSVRLASRWFPPKHMALVVGLIVTFAMTGAMIAQTPFTILTQHYGWRHTLLIDSMAGFVMLMLIVLFVRDYPKGDRQKIATQQQQLNELGVIKTIVAALKNTQNWLAGIYSSLVNLPVFLLGSWGMMYLHQIFGLTRRDASIITSMLFVGLIFGSPAFGALSDAMGRRRLPMIIGAVLSLIVMLPIMYMQHLSFHMLAILFFLIGFMISSQIISYAVVAESNPEALTGAAEGVTAMLIMSGGFLIPIFAQLLDLNWHHYFVQGLPVYSLHAYHVAFLLMPVAFILSILTAIAVKETYCRSFEERQHDDAKCGD